MSKKNINPNAIQKLINTLKFYDKGNIIYPGLIIRKLNIKMSEAYNLLDEIEKTKIIKRNFEIYCNKCQRYTGEIYESLNDIPDNLICDTCDRELSLFNNIIVVYKVMVD
ncbi:response regulator [Bacillus toyonensis]|uniref:response regulator n=1 Tax=Bacillus toyonensis TaxID=155322 RepID=UPI0015CF1E57|nr:response regulator [Bacillus toyonensis]